MEVRWSERERFVHQLQPNFVYMEVVVVVGLCPYPCPQMLCPWVPVAALNLNQASVLIEMVYHPEVRTALAVLLPVVALRPCLCVVLPSDSTFLAAQRNQQMRIEEWLHAETCLIHDFQSQHYVFEMFPWFG